MAIVLYPAGGLLGRGDESRAVMGTGLSRLRGVDAVWEYNGLIMNYRRWRDTYIIDDIDGIDDADVSDSREIRPGEHGEIARDSFYRGRSIVLSGKIRAFSYEKMLDMRDALQEAFNDLSEKPLVIHNVDPSKDIQAFVKKNNKIVIKETQSNWQWERAFQIPLRASREYFQSRLENYAEFNPTTGASIMIPNMGNWRSAPRFRLYGGYGTGFVIKNFTTGLNVKLTFPVGAMVSGLGNYVTVDMLRKTIVSQSGVNMMQYFDNQSDFFTLVKGNNEISVQNIGTANGSIRAEVYWTDNYK